TSTSTPIASPPDSFVAVSAAFAGAAVGRSAMTTRAPAPSNVRAYCRPSSPAPPVTIATRDDKSNMASIRSGMDRLSLCRLFCIERDLQDLDSLMQRNLGRRAVRHATQKVAHLIDEHGVSLKVIRHHRFESAVRCASKFPDQRTRLK